MILSMGPQRVVLTFRALLSRALLSRVLWFQSLLRGMCGIIQYCLIGNDLAADI